MGFMTSKIRKLLLPFAWLYGGVVNIRNWMYDRNIYKQYKFDIPVICVGNITVGGTGKTPHIEYLIELLSPHYKVGVLSRGYKRKSKGFCVVEVNTTAEEVGDEPLQIKRKYPHALVYVDKDRKSAIEKIMDNKAENRPDLILLDDGYQHRRVRPSLSILLVDSNRPIHEDRFLPAGNLRESFKGRHRASIVIVTKCKRDMSPIEFRICETNLDLFPFQKLYYSTFDYGDLKPVFQDIETETMPISCLNSKHILLVTGIAMPKPFKDFLTSNSVKVDSIEFPDHHHFDKEDIKSIENHFAKMDVDADNKIIITTEKDATRLRTIDNINENVKRNLYYVPIQVVFLKNKDKESFNKKIFKHVRNYQTNG